jgi:hypothetical protein
VPKSLKSRLERATLHFDISQALNSFNKSQLLALFSAFLYTYLISIISIFFIVEKLSRKQNATFRLSLQSQMGFGVEPSSFTILICFFTAFIIFLLLVITLKYKLTIQILKLFSELLIPSCIVFFISVLGFLFGKIDLRLANFSLKEISKTLWISVAWSGVATFGIAILISVLLALIFANGNKSDSMIQKDLSFIPWLIPVLINTGFLAAVTGASTLSGRFLIWFALIPNLILFLLFSVYNSNSKIKQIVITLVLGLCVFVYFFSHRPTQVLTWRPELKLISITDDRYLFFSISISLIICILLLTVSNFYQWVTVVIAGLWCGLSSNINSTVVSSLDNFHHGELMGYWLGFSEFDQLPYKSVEFPRGMFVNILPAAFGDFLSNGYPETFSYWFVFLSFLMGMLFFLVTRWYLPLPVIFFILILLPKPNGYSEIDLTMGIVLLWFIAALKNARSTTKLFILAPPLSIFLILLTPGQGIICVTLLLVVGVMYVRQNAISLKFLRRLPWIIYYLGMFAIGFIAVFPSILWVVRNGSVNNAVYGDFWLGKILEPQQFPLSFKFGILLLVPVFLIVLLVKFRNLENFQKQLAFAGILFLVAFSGRWFGRADGQNMSRIGAGLFIFLVVFLVPLTYRKTSPGRIPVAGVVSIILTTCLAVAHYPFNQPINFQRIASSSVLSGQYAEMQQRGEVYKKIKEIETHLYGDDTKRLNLTGGQAIDEYLGTRSFGGIESPYVITNDSQESEWKERLEKAEINIVLGPYGSFGAGAFDGSGVGGRSPQILSWVVKHFIPVDCNSFTLAIRKSEVQKKIAYLNSQGCAVPSSRSELLSLWNRIDATQSNLGWSLLSWKSKTSSQNQFIDGGKSTIQVTMKKFTEILTIQLSCMNPQSVEFFIDSNDSGERIKHLFYAQVQSGSFAFKPSMFPIVSMLKGNFSLGMNSSTCSFV